jgi:hypothetical protein
MMPCSLADINVLKRPSMYFHLQGGVIQQLYLYDYRFFNNTHHRIYVNAYRTAVESEEMIMIIDFIFFSFFFFCGTKANIGPRLPDCWFLDHNN